MQQEKLSFKQGIYLLILFIIGSSIILPLAASAKQDAWLAIIIAALAALPMYMIYARILYLNPGCDLFFIIKKILGSFLGTVINIVFIWYALHLAALVLNNFGEFINVASLPETPKIVMMMMISLLILWVVKEGIEVTARCGEIFLPIIIVGATLTFLLLIPKLQLTRIQPMLYDGIGPVLESAFGVFSFPFGEAVVFLFVFSSIRQTKQIYKIMGIGLGIGAVIIMFSAVMVLMVIGPERYASHYFPSYLAVREISIGDFLQRLEVVVFIITIFAGFIKIGVCLLAASKGVAAVTKSQDYRFLVTPMAVLMLSLACILYTNNKEMTEWAVKVYPYYAFPFQVILPLLIWIGAEIQERSKRNTPLMK